MKVTRAVATKVIIAFSSVILTLTNFGFSSINYLQITEYTMGLICVSAYANLFVPRFEKQHIYPYIKTKSILYLQYTYGIFMIWIGNNGK